MCFITCNMSLVLEINYVILSYLNSTKSSIKKLSTSYNNVLHSLLCILKPYSASNNNNNNINVYFRHKVHMLHIDFLYIQCYILNYIKKQ